MFTNLRFDIANVSKIKMYLCYLYCTSYMVVSCTTSIALFTFLTSTKPAYPKMPERIKFLLLYF